jgi:hypothetical protein
MAKARTTLTMSVKVRLPVGINAQDMMSYFRDLLRHGQPILDPQNHTVIKEALADEDTVVKLVQKVTEYK